MVAPLYVYAAVGHEIVKYDMGFRASVENISDQMESVYSHVRYCLCKVADKISACVILDDGIDDLIIIAVSVRYIVCEQELVHDIG